MSPEQPFSACLSVPDDEVGRLVGARIASSAQTGRLIEKPEFPHDNRKYQQSILDMIRGQTKSAAPPRAIDRILVEKFARLANYLQISKAVSLPFTETEVSLMTDWADIRHTPIGKHTYLSGTPGITSEPCMQRSLLHPLVIALLAYQMGGPINASGTFSAHQWKLSDSIAADASEFHQEGGTESSTDDYRVTLVWQEVGDKAMAPSGEHHIFTDGSYTPQSLKPLPMTGDYVEAPELIIYSCKDITLCYNSTEQNAIRNSLSLDYHVNIITDEDLDLLGEEPPNQRTLNHLTLSQLVFQLPIQGYKEEFKLKLFACRDPILAALENINVPDPGSCTYPASTQRSKHEKLQQRHQVWKADNEANVPQSVRDPRYTFPLTGVYTDPSSFVKRVAYKMLQDLHLPLGMDMVPQDVLDEQRELARQRIRDIDLKRITNTLAAFTSTLISNQYGRDSLLATSQLRGFANNLAANFLDVVSRGYINGSHTLYSLSSLASTLGKALDSPDALYGTEDGNLAVTDADLQIYRTRCLYLFWCADSLVRYLASPTRGHCMVHPLTQDEVKGMQRETLRIAESLLRNWVAWGLFVEGLPKGGFTAQTARRHGD